MGDYLTAGLGVGVGFRGQGGYHVLKIDALAEGWEFLIESGKDGEGGVGGVGTIKCGEKGRDERFTRFTVVQLTSW